jgi:hypothetical protein
VGVTEQRLFARVLRAGTAVSVAVLVLAFGAYVAGVAPARVPLDEMPRYWGLAVGEYLRQTGLPRGWGWLALLRHGETMTLAGVSLLTSVSIVAYLAILPGLLGRREAALALIVMAELGILMLAASGVLGARP